MASILKVDTIQDQSGNNIINENADTITIGASGDTVTVPTGATLDLSNATQTGVGGTNTPAFSAQMGGGTQSFSVSTVTIVQFDTEKFDTDSAFDTASYEFTVPVGKGGKYFIHGKVFFNDIASTDLFQELYIYVNGSRISTGGRRTVGTTGRDGVVTVSEILVLSAGDVVDMRIQTNAGSGTLGGDNALNFFEGFKIIE